MTLAIGINTSSNSPNVIEAMKKVKKQHLKTIGLAGKDRGILRKCVDIPIIVAIANTGSSTDTLQSDTYSVSLRKSIRFGTNGTQQRLRAAAVPKPPITA